MMRSDTKERNDEFVTHQLKFNSDIMLAADDLLADENRILKLVSRKNKKFLKDILPELVGDGIKFRNGKVFTPEHLLNDLVRDDRWITLKAKAETAIEKMKLYEEAKWLEITEKAKSMAEKIKALEEKRNSKNKN